MRCPYASCVFNSGAFLYATDKETRDDSIVYLEHGKPLVFGKERDKGIRLHALTPEVVSLKDVKQDDLLIHDEKTPEPSLAFLLSQMRYPDFPEPMGVFRAVERERYGETVRRQIKEAVEKKGEGDLQSLVSGTDTWTVG